MKIKNLKIKTSAILLSGVSLVLVLSSLPNREYNPNYSINEEYNLSDINIPFATSSRGDIYIGSEEEIETIVSEVDHSSILIVDERSAHDPNIRIQSSCQITNKDEMEEILEVVQTYNDLYPSSWDRSVEAMMNEWEIHNICSNLSLFSSHTDEVDLNNDDELLYSSKVLTKILRN